MAEQLANRARSTLAVGIDNTTDPITLTVQSGAGAVFSATGPFRVLVKDAVTAEIMLATSRSGDVITATRAQEGTTKQTFASGALVAEVLTAAALRALLAEHPAVTTDAHVASAVSVIPAGRISSTTVQAALEEISAESEMFLSGAGSPEGAATATPTTLYRDTTNNELYLKAGGAGNTGWALMTHADPTTHAGFAQLIFPANDHTQYIQNVMVNAKGDLIVATADDTVTRLAVGANGTRLVADSTASEGVKWA